MNRHLPQTETASDRLLAYCLVGIASGLTGSILGFLAGLAF